MEPTAHDSPSADVGHEVQSCIPVQSKPLRPEHQPRRLTLVSEFISNLLSYLGPSNPWPQPVTKDDELWLMDNTAFPTTKKGEDGKDQTVWEAEFVAAVFLQHPSCAVSDAVIAIAEKIGLADDEQAKRTIETRLRPFLMDIQPGKQVHALYGSGGPLHLKLSPGGRSGISVDRKTIPAAPSGTVVSTSAEVPAGTTGVLQCKTFFAEAEGWGVISDIDDTIKITLTGNPAGLLRSTLVDAPQPVPGMPELYAFLRSRLSDTDTANTAVAAAPPFFYLSASPYNLYPFLRDFRDAYYPHGQLLLRDASWMSLPGLLGGSGGLVAVGTEAYKVARMRRLHAWLPRRRMICIGDSTQRDPEAYASMYRDYGGADWVALVLIRRVAGVAVAGGLDDKNRPERFEAAFRGVPRSVWHVFERPEECYRIIREVTGSSGGAMGG